MPRRLQPTQTTRRPLPHRFRSWGICVLESHHAADFQMVEEKHDFLQILFVIQGRAALHARTVQPLEAGDICVVPIGQEHHVEDDPQDPLSLYVLSIRPAVLELASLPEDALPVGRLPRNALLSAQVEAIVRQLLFEQTLDRPQSGAMVIGLTLQMLASLVPAGHAENGAAASPEPPRDSYARVRAYIAELEGRFFETKPLDDVANDLGMSRRRFTQVFRELAGTSWLAYLRLLRVEHAKRLLQQTHRTIASIAFECGFEDLSTFYRAFKREVGTSPSRWRQGRGQEWARAADLDRAPPSSSKRGGPGAQAEP